MADETLSVSPARTKAEARAMGLKKYFTGRPCKRGHLAERYVSDPNCIECLRLHDQNTREQRREYLRGWRERDRADPARRPKRRARNRRVEIRRIERLQEIAGRPRPTKCELCGASGKRAISFDHCHATGKFRGWLCDNCNLTLGMVKENPAVLRALADYIERGGVTPL